MFGYVAIAEDAISEVSTTIVLSSVFGTGQIGAVTLKNNVTCAGVQGIGAAGTVSFLINSNVLVTGVSGNGIVGDVLRRGWTQINNTQSPDWVVIDVAA